MSATPESSRTRGPTVNATLLDDTFVDEPPSTPFATARLAEADIHGLRSDPNLLAALMLAEDQRRRNLILQQISFLPSSAVLTPQELLLEDIRQRERLLAQREANLAAATAGLPLLDGTGAGGGSGLFGRGVCLNNMLGGTSMSLPLAGLPQDATTLAATFPLPQQDLTEIVQARLAQGGAISGNHNPSESASAKPAPTPRKARTGTFPQKLHQMLADLEDQEGGSDIASFLPSGKAFVIHKPKEFADTIMAKYFRMSRFSSFQRQLNLYEFQRITEGPDKGAYRHSKFIKSNPSLAMKIKRNKIKGHGKTSAPVVTDTAAVATATNASNPMFGANFLSNGTSLSTGGSLTARANAIAALGQFPALHHGNNGLGGLSGLSTAMSGPGNLASLHGLTTGQMEINDFTTVGDLRRLLAARHGL